MYVCMYICMHVCMCLCDESTFIYTCGVLMAEQMKVDTDEDKKSMAGFR